MKNLILFITLLLISGIFSQAQVSWTRTEVAEADVPIAVKNTHTISFPDSPADRWEKATRIVKNTVHTKYIALFKQNHQRVRARYKESGSGLSATTYFVGSKLPQAIQDAAAANYSGYKLRSGEKIQSLAGGQKEVYRIRLRKGAQKLVVYVDESGKEIEKGSVPEMMKEDEEVEG